VEAAPVADRDPALERGALDDPVLGAAVDGEVASAEHLHAVVVVGAGLQLHRRVRLSFEAAAEDLLRGRRLHHRRTQERRRHGRAHENSLHAHLLNTSGSFAASLPAHVLPR
jgi:hypothetical protein